MWSLCEARVDLSLAFTFLREVAAGPGGQPRLAEGGYTPCRSSRAAINVAIARTTSTAALKGAPGTATGSVR